MLLAQTWVRLKRAGGRGRMERRAATWLSNHAEVMLSLQISTSSATAAADIAINASRRLTHLRKRKIIEKTRMSS
ncbi:MAG: hypothetical protein ACJ8CF_14120 [Microvirga sp.]